MTKQSLKCIVLILAAGVSACGGGSGSGGGAVVVPPTSSTPPPSPPSSTSCSLVNRQNFAASVLNEWYLFPETLPSALDSAAYTSVQAYINALTATARGQGRDRYFTYVTSIQEENAYYASGATAGFGVRLAYQGSRSAGISSALGPNTVGTSRVLRISDASGARNITVAKADYNIDPLSSRYGVKVIDNGGGQRVGYVNMRTFISTADNQLRTAFADFRAQGITNFVIDFRYNGGGLVSTAEVMGDLLAGNRFSSDIFSVTRFRASKASNNETKRFAPQTQSVSPVKIAFIATGATASASELVMASFVPYLGVNAALIGSNSYGKPVGQIALDLTACDDRIRVVAFAKENAAGQGDYYSGLAGTMRSTCAAADDITRPLGDPQEASLRTALDFIAGRSCTAIVVGQSAQSASTRTERRVLPVPENANTAQRDVSGSF